MLSCVICVRDGARFIGEAIDSAQAALEPDDEILVIDDGSRDDTPAVSAAAVAPGKARVRVCSGPPEGIVAARNRGLAEVKGDLLVFLDHDDRFDSQGLTRLRDCIERKHNCDAVFGQWRNFIDETYRPEPGAASKIDCSLQSRRFFTAAIYRTRAFETVGVFSDRFANYPELDWTMRADAQDLPFSQVEALVLYRRIHDRNASWHKPRDELLRLVAARRKHFTE